MQRVAPGVLRRLTVVHAFGVVVFVAQMGTLRAQDAEDGNVEIFPLPGDRIAEKIDPKAVTFIRYQSNKDEPATNRDLAQVAECVKVRDVIVMEAAISDAGLEHLKTLKHVEFLNLTDNPRIEGEGLKYLAECPSLKTLTLNDTRTTSIALRHLVDFPAIETLDLSRTMVDDDGMEALSDTRSLRRLDLSYTRIGDVGAYHISKLAGLVELNLNGTTISNLGMAHIGRLEGLHTLRLMRTRVSDDGIEHIRQLRSLRILDLENADSISDKGLAHISNLAALEGLSLSGDGITDEGLATLARLKNLKYLRLFETRTTEAGTDQLKSVLTDLEITHFPAGE